MKPVVAVVLLVAAALKAHELATVPVVASGLLESRWFLVAVVQYELFLAVWLLSGLFPRTAWWITIGTFGLLAVVSASKALAGDPTCGCFGRVPTSPWLSLSINMAAILGLVGDFVLVEPERMLDGPFALGQHIDIGDRLASGRWLVVLYRADCPACQSLLEELTAMQSQWNERPQIAWIGVGTALNSKQSPSMISHARWLTAKNGP